MTGNDQHLKLWYRVGFAGFGLIGLFTVISGISLSCEYGSPFSHPSIAVPILLITGTVLAFLALRTALKIENPQSSLLFLILCIGISLRAISLFTTPILEIDYYRYIWDGKVSAEGVSPYFYSPARTLRAEPSLEPSYQQVVALSTKSESNFTILQRIHFADYRTIYPPVSQFVFAAAMKWFPHTASVSAHIILIKAVMVLFELLTMWLVCLLLKRLALHQGWLIAYAWNPLVIKEIANSGHLDSIVSFFVVASIYLVTRWVILEKSEQKPVLPFLPLLSGLTLGLGVGAKLFPVVLFPALFCTLARYQWSKATLFALSFTVTGTLCLWPMYQATSKVEHAVSVEKILTEPMSNSLGASDKVVADNKEGLSSFLAQWRMNDVIFSGLYLNLKPDNSDRMDDRGSSPWFVVSSNEFRKQVARWCQSIGLGGTRPTFMLTRIVTMSLFAMFYVWQLIGIYREQESGAGINFERLTWIAVVFLFLQPTVNPWYWVWIAPLACLSRNAGWLLVSGCLMAYYFRFWFKSIEGTYQFAGTGYSGERLFDFGLAWVEFACIVVVVVWFYFLTRGRTIDVGGAEAPK